MMFWIYFIMVIYCWRLWYNTTENNKYTLLPKISGFGIILFLTLMFLTIGQK